MILLSGGHYPAKKGASHKGTSEYPLTLEWAERIGELLKSKYGLDSLIVPTGGLTSKVKFINSKKPTIAVEVHFNSVASGTARGSETLYCPNSKKGLALATSIQNRLGLVSVVNRGVKEGFYQMDRTNKPDYFLRATNCPAVIVEPAFIQNLTFIHDHKETCCKAIARGIYEYTTG